MRKSFIVAFRTFNSFLTRGLGSVVAQSTPKYICFKSIIKREFNFSSVISRTVDASSKITRVFEFNSKVNMKDNCQ